MRRQRGCQRGRENGVATSMYGNMTPFLRHFHVAFDVTSCLLKLPNPATATSMLSFKLIDFLISTLGQNYQSLANDLHPFLKVIYTKAPGNMEDIKTLVASLPSVFLSDVSATLHNEFQVFFQYLDQQRSSGDSHEGYERQCEISRAVLELARKHGLFKYVSKVYQLFLTAAPSVCKNERSFSALKRIKNNFRSSMSRARLHACIILPIERDLLYELDLKKLALKWSLLKDRREKL